MQAVDANGWREQDYDGLVVEAEAGGFSPVWLGTVIAAESEFQKDTPNREGSGAVGLTQFMPDVLRALNWRPGTPAYDLAGGDFGKAPVGTQLEYVYRYFAGWRRRFGLSRWRSRAQMYLANFLPADLPHGADGSFVLAQDQGRRPKVYEQNWKALDRNRDGKILVQEIELFLVAAITGRAKRAFSVFLDGLARARGRRGGVDESVMNNHDDRGPTDVGDVRAIQTALMQHGFDPGPLDGVLGPRTAAAVRAFQQRRGLVVDGIVGVATWSALAREVLAQVA